MSDSVTLNIKGMSPQLLVADLDRSIEFYTKNLGFEVRFRYKDFYSGIARDSYSIHLKVAETSTAERNSRKENGHLYIFFSVEGVDALHKEMTQKPLQIIQPLCDMPYGREFTLPIRMATLSLFSKTYLLNLISILLNF